MWKTNLSVQSIDLPCLEVLLIFAAVLEVDLAERSSDVTEHTLIYNT